MENQHRKIKGYRELDEYEIQLMNRIKSHGQRTKELYVEVENYLFRTQRELHNISKEDATEMNEFMDAEPHHWLDKARESGSESIMFAVRAVARPTTF